ncbi:MAG TPA: hypothetical protein PKW18_06130 [Candidatus Sumerlaeota bacterium]|nr:hypothetical protein [Candidatus Sumerlaeota bacterium]HON50168.1 hypothetical protein [Candidatus Sumerlaeota bacterium]HOR63384.1 hypothetical protein [Candidatus Sumerlaeota bacterium]HPL74135.1 hypothetical protein [Candidatus Sumerlaeota bacterium]HRU54329.1 hypothetical protein [Candidatus Sumerlaeia bacterium]
MAFLERHGRIISLSGLTLILILAIYVRLPAFYFEAKGFDTYFVWLDGKRIAEGKNPYARILSGDMIHNDKYATRLPLVYLMAALIIRTGSGDYESFLSIWRIFILFFDLAVGLYIFQKAAGKGSLLLGLFLIFTWFFARWGLYTWEIANSEPFMLFMLILALEYWDEKPVLAGILFGVSLSMKHIGVLFLPVMLAASGNWKEAARRLGYVAIFPLVISIPFFIWGPYAYIKSLLFSGVRDGNSHLLSDSKSIMLLFGSYGIKSRIIPMLAFIIFWAAALKEKWNKWLVACLAFYLFISFNPVLFTQYFVWMLPFLLIYLIERGDETDKNVSKTSHTAA